MEICKKRRALLPLLLMPLTLALPGCRNKALLESAPEASTPAPDNALKVAFVYIGPIGEAGWTFAHDLGRRSLEAHYGDRIKTSYVENVADGPASEKVFRDLAAQGNRIIFGTTFGYMESMLKVAQDFPDVKFEHATGYKTAPNMATYDVRSYEGAYLAGIIAGKKSRSGKLGFVASIPIPEVIRNINAFLLGARSINPDAVLNVAWVHQWFDPAKERAAALALLGQGADVLIQNTDSNAVLKTAEEKGAMAFGWDSDMTRFGPGAHLGSVAADWSHYYRTKVDGVLNGTWSGGAVWWGLKENSLKIASPNPGLPQEFIVLLGEKLLDMKAGKLKPFQGPILAQDGQPLLTAGMTFKDADLKSMDFYVQGVNGSIPK